ncbi:MAG: hypothetical protein DRJ43_03135 [Thermoprotei archaeon]|nr:MAG: hypothetical protein DRJ43_03135 [Thermoprotei archaeon]HDD56868.1 hypothetical protein [Nitrososphaeria archaeon]
MKKFYEHLRYCPKCGKWYKAEDVLDLCPKCGCPLRTAPRYQRFKRRYINTKKWSLAEAVEMFKRYVNDGCDVEEALELVEARTGFKLNPPLLEVEVRSP